MDTTTATRLILMRHAKSDWYSGEQDDFLRSLNERGMRDARHMGRWLARENLLPGSILCSPSRRTQQTLEQVSVGAEVALEARTRLVTALYHSDLATLLTVLREAGDASDLMLLGHNPGLEELLDYLVDNKADAGFSKQFPTAAVYVLEFDVGLPGLARHVARIRYHQRPKMLDR